MVLVAHVAVVGTLGYLVGTSRGRVARDPVTGDFYLQYSLAYKILPLILTVCIAIIALCVTYGVPITPSNATIYLAVALPISAALIYLTLETTGTVHRVTHEGIRAHSPWREDRLIRWEEIIEIRFAGLAQTLDIVTARGRLRLHLYLSGLGDLAERLVERVPESRWKKAAKVLNMLRRR